MAASMSCSSRDEPRSWSQKHAYSSNTANQRAGLFLHPQGLVKMGSGQPQLLPHRVPLWNLSVRDCLAVRETLQAVS